MKEDQEFNVKFIKLIEERPVLYNYHRSDYSNRHSQDGAWFEISKIVSESVPDCKERWKNLRGCYTRHLKKLKRTKLYGSSKFVRPYYLAENLKFLSSFTKCRPLGDDEDTEESSQDPLIVPDDVSEDSVKFETSPSALQQKIDKSMPCTSDEQSFYKPVCEKIIKKPKRVSSSGSKAIAKSNQKRRKSNQSEDIDDQDPDLAFFYSLIPDMKDMSRDQKLRFKVGVLNLAGEILQENNWASPASQYSDGSGQSS